MKYYTFDPDNSQPVHVAISTIQKYAGHCTSAVEPSSDRTFVVVTVTASQLEHFLKALDEMKAFRISLSAAHCSHKGVAASLHLVEDAMRAAGHASRFPEVLAVSTEGHVWTKTPEVGILVSHAIFELSVKEAYEKRADETDSRIDGVYLQSEEHGVELTSEPDFQVDVGRLPEWKLIMVEYLRNKQATCKTKKGFDFGFTCRLDLVHNGRELRAVAYFATLSGAKAFVDELNPSSLTLTFGDDLKNTVKFEKPRIATRKIDTVQDIIEGIKLGNSATPSCHVRGDVAMLHGPRRTGKTVVAAALAGRRMQLSEKSELMSLNPLSRDDFGGQVQRLQNNFVLVKSSVTVSLSQRIVADRSCDLLRGVAVPNTHEFVPLHLATEVPLKTEETPEVAWPGGLDVEYELVPDDEWKAVQDMLAGDGTPTLDIHAYDIGRDFTLLDAPGTDDPRGLAGEVRNALLRYKALKRCNSIRLVIVIDFGRLECACGENLPMMLAPVACALRNYAEDIQHTAVLLTRMPSASKMIQEKSEQQMISWLSHARARVAHWVGGSMTDNPVVGPFLRHLLKELEITEERLLGDATAPWGKATVVHPLSSADTYLKGVIEGAKPLTAEAFHASVGLHGSARLAECFALRLLEFKHACYQREYDRAVELAANMLDALLQLEKYEVHFDPEVAQVDTVITTMKESLRHRRTFLLEELQSTLSKRNHERWLAASQAFRTFDKSIREAVKAIHRPEVRQCVSDQLGIGDGLPEAAEVYAEMVARSFALPHRASSVDSDSDANSEAAVPALRDMRPPEDHAQELQQLRQQNQELLARLAEKEAQLKALEQVQNELDLVSRDHEEEWGKEKQRTVSTSI